MSQVLHSFVVMPAPMKVQSSPSLPLLQRKSRSMRQMLAQNYPRKSSKFTSKLLLFKRHVEHIETKLEQKRRILEGG